MKKSKIHSIAKTLGRALGRHVNPQEITNLMIPNVKRIRRHPGVHISYTT